MKQSKADIEHRLARAVSDETPDVLPRVLLRLKEQKGQEDTMDMTMTPPKHNKKAFKAIRWVAAVAAVLALAIGIWSVSAFFQTDSLVYVDANPGVELRVNRSGRVLAAQALNGEAQTVLQDMDLKNVDLNVALNAIVGAMFQNGYISEAKNTVLISVMNQDADRAQALQTQLAGEVGGILQSFSLDGAVLSQTLPQDEQLEQLAAQYGISLGKAALVQLLVNQDPLLNFAEIAALPVSDIYLLLSSKPADFGQLAHTGQANSGAYIGDEAALQTALTHAGVTQAQLVSCHIELDYDDGRMCYDIEFYAQSTEYDYTIDAVSGAVLEYEQDTEDAHMQHAGLEESQVTFVKLAQYEKRGVYLYDLEFLSDTHKYRYEIEAYTGEILAHYVNELHGPGASDGTQHPQGGQSGASPSQGASGMIGESEAARIALAHAGALMESVTEYSIKLDDDDGRIVYEIEFVHTGTEYDYEIDAYTGQIVDYDFEPVD